MDACAVAGRCGGCPWLGRPQPAQRSLRVAALREAFRVSGVSLDVEIPVHAVDGRRDRVDLTWDGQTLGLYDLTGDSLVDVGPCPALSSPLRALLAEVQRRPPSIPRASLRLRAGPDGERGMWVDAANTDLAELLHTGDWLRPWIDAGVFVEAGQRRKPVVVDGDRLRLQRQPELRPWFATWAGDRKIPLFGTVGGFTQPSLAANRALVEVALSRTSPGTWVDLGCGGGNFALALAASGRTVVGVDSDAQALQALQASAERAGLAVRAEKWSFSDAHAPFEVLWASADGVIADPPRSGLGVTAERLARSGPARVVLVSCFGESLARDVGVLVAGGYRIAALEGVDQFPNTPHGEWVAALVR